MIFCWASSRIAHHQVSRSVRIHYGGLLPNLETKVRRIVKVEINILDLKETIKLKGSGEANNEMWLDPLIEKAKIR